MTHLLDPYRAPSPLGFGSKLRFKVRLLWNCNMLGWGREEHRQCLQWAATIYIQ